MRDQEVVMDQHKAPGLRQGRRVKRRRSAPARSITEQQVPGDGVDVGVEVEPESCMIEEYKGKG